jgi:prepilin-type N-terminal cleavage/methylation domain-containing protein/prepilin-type processing-associated H-X9-DG protein
MTNQTGALVPNRRRRESELRRAFTIIELLVVVAIIGLLLAILAPSLAAARAEARSVVCATNLHHVGQAASMYASKWQKFPVSYAYVPLGERLDLSSNGQESAQQTKHLYAHWSHFLYQGGTVSAQAFQCAEYPDGGAPRTNPGPKAENWEGGQVDDNMQSSPNSVEDLQAPRMSYTANAAIMPRNKFTRSLSGGLRVNKFVNDTEVKFGSKTIMATEFNNNWNALGVQKTGDGLLVKSHRPINPFYHFSSGWDEYNAPVSRSGRAGFVLGDPNAADYGLLPLSHLGSKPGLIESSEINAIGRHHPGGDKIMGGTTNFLYVDSHVENKTVFDTFKNREWGDRYYSLSGNNQVAK